MSFLGALLCFREFLCLMLFDHGSNGVIQWRDVDEIYSPGHVICCFLLLVVCSSHDGCFKFASFRELAPLDSTCINFYAFSCEACVWASRSTLRRKPLRQRVHLKG